MGMNSAAQKELAHSGYWNRYYAGSSQSEESTSNPHEWFRTFSELQPFLARRLPDASRDPRIIQLGCGMSTLTVDLYHLGYTKQVNVDFSPVAIDAMKKQHASLHLDWLLMDVRHMTFPGSSFDVAIDKGTLDAMIHGSLWDPEEEVKQNVGAYVDEVARILKPGGKWLYISYRQPHFLRPLLDRPGVWDVHVETLGGPGGTFDYFGFEMWKHDSP